MGGKYIYGIIEAATGGTWDISGPGGSGPVHAVGHRDLACVVSDYSGPGFSSLPREEVLRCLLAHQRVVERVMGEHTVLPVKFGTLLTSIDQVRDLLAQGYQQFAGTLSRIDDKVEVEVAATWDVARVLGEIASEEKIVRAREALASTPQPTLEARLKLGQMVKACLDRHRDSYQQRMVGFLAPAAVDVQPNALLAEELVMNVAFLVERAKQGELDARVERLAELFQGQVRFRVIGPLPPYSFATAEVARPDPEQLEAARQLLGLGQSISAPEVRRAYRLRAAQAHPDLGRGEGLVLPSEGLAGPQLFRLHGAAKLLIACCRGVVGPGGGFLINISRNGNEGLPHFHGAETEPVAGGSYG